MFWSKRLCSFYFHKDTEHFRYELRLIFWIFRHNMTKQPKLWVKKKKKKKKPTAKECYIFSLPQNFGASIYELFY